ncbi:MAG: hypothetical protein KDA57_19925 [Planctomycetales bacterium]|nr:hypothetical protein [Planctomycetales bacterium]
MVFLSVDAPFEKAVPEEQGAVAQGPAEPLLYALCRTQLEADSSVPKRE